jgi:putative oxidoreductase
MFTLTRDDFRIQASSFDLTKGSNVLRIACGAFMFPHIAGKFANGTFNPGTLGFFAKAGMTPPEFWLGLAALSEFLVGVFLVLGLCTRFAALGGSVVLLMAVYALQVVKGFGWTWNTGGYEYPVFWAIASVVVAMEAWKVYFAESRRVPAGLRSGLRPA